MQKKVSESAANPTNNGVARLPLINSTKPERPPESKNQISLDLAKKLEQKFSNDPNVAINENGSERFAINIYAGDGGAVIRVVRGPDKTTLKVEIYGGDLKEVMRNSKEYHLRQDGKTWTPLNRATPPSFIREAEAILKLAIESPTIPLPPVMLPLPLEVRIHET